MKNLSYIILFIFGYAFAKEDTEAAKNALKQKIEAECAKKSDYKEELDSTQKNTLPYFLCMIKDFSGHDELMSESASLIDILLFYESYDDKKFLAMLKKIKDAAPNVKLEEMNRCYVKKKQDTICCLATVLAEESEDYVGKAATAKADFDKYEGVTGLFLSYIRMLLKHVYKKNLNDIKCEDNKTAAELYRPILESMAPFMGRENKGEIVKFLAAPEIFPPEVKIADDKQCDSLPLVGDRLFDGEKSYARADITGCPDTCKKKYPHGHTEIWKNFIKKVKSNPQLLEKDAEFEEKVGSCIYTIYFTSEKKTDVIPDFDFKKRVDEARKRTKGQR